MWLSNQTLIPKHDDDDDDDVVMIINLNYFDAFKNLKHVTGRCLKYKKKIKIRTVE
jgi:hypothetical protein